MSIYTDTIQQMYVAYFNRPADVSGLANWEAYAAGKDLAAVKAAISTEFAKSAEYTIVFQGMTTSQIVTKVYQNLLGRDPDAAGLTNWINHLATGTSTVSSLVTDIIRDAGPGDVDTLANKLSAAKSFTAALDTVAEINAYSGATANATAAAWLATVGQTAASLTAATASLATTVSTISASGGGVAGSIFTLTTGADNLSPNSLTTATKTTANDDTIYANDDGAFSGGDVIDGGNGTDTIYSVQATTAAETITPVISNVEKVYIDVNDGTAGTAATYTFSGSTATGLTEVWSNAYSGSTNGTEDTFAITGVSTSVATGIKGGDGEYHVTTTYSSVTGSSDSAKLKLEGASVDTVTIAGIETLNVEIVGAASTTTGASTIATLTDTSLGTVNITGARNLTVTNNIDFKDATDTLAFDGTVEASGMSGNLTLTLGTGGDNVKFTGGSGKNTVVTGAGNDTLTGGAAADTFTVGAGNDTVNTGAGNDRVIIAVADLTSADSITLGEGTDTLQVSSTTLDAAAVDATALALVNKISGLDAIATSGALTAIDAGYFTQTAFEATAALTAAVTMTNVAGDSLKLSTGLDLGAAGTAGDALTVSGALPNQTFTLELNGAAGVNLIADNGTAGNAALVIASGISTVNLVSSTTSTTAVTNTITSEAASTAVNVIDNVSAGSFVLTGSTDLTISGGTAAGAVFSKAVDFNASAFTGKLSIGGSLEADIIKGGSGADTINGDDGDDILTGNGGADTFVFISADGSGAPSATVFETITDYAKSVDIIDWDANLTIDAAAATAVATTAQVSSKGIATFHADDDTLAERIVAATKGMDADGDFVVFEHGSDTYVYISGDNNATQDAADALIKLTGVTGITTATIDGNNNLLLS
ncbi:MAG TPA: DUF4214 domain-containing protein [Noviherbaspirillum sp.]|nr:DUF4214 domain-containing protein [Noviherbaspirillum sp.]